MSGPTRTVYACTRCGGERIDYSAWLDLNTGEDTGSEGPTDDLYCADCDGETSVDEVTRPETPADRLRDARRALRMLRHARDVAKAAGAPRLADRIRGAIKSAGGAVRHAEGRAVRSEAGR